MTSLFDVLVLKLATVVELAQQAEGEPVPTPELKQALVRAVRSRIWGFIPRSLSPYMVDKWLQGKCQAIQRSGTYFTWGRPFRQGARWGDRYARTIKRKKTVMRCYSMLISIFLISISASSCPVSPKESWRYLKLRKVSKWRSTRQPLHRSPDRPIVIMGTRHFLVQNAFQYIFQAWKWDMRSL